MSKENGAISLLCKAVELDTKKQYTSALVCYKEGLTMLMDIIKDTKDMTKKSKFREKATEYMNRAEALQKIIDSKKKEGSFHEFQKIAENSIGNSYMSLFGRFLDTDVFTITVEDPYIRAHHQIINFLRFVELVIRKCPNVKKIHLVTKTDESSPHSKEEQISKLKELSSEVKIHGPELTYTFSSSLHDRQIKLNTGWIIKIGRGLDIYKAPKSKWSPGCYDFDLRPCLETTIDIYHGESVAKS